MLLTKRFSFVRRKLQFALPMSQSPHLDCGHMLQYLKTVKRIGVCPILTLPALSSAAPPLDPFISSNAPLMSQDSLALEYSLMEDADIVISTSALVALMDNFFPFT